MITKPHMNLGLYIGIHPSIWGWGQTLFPPSSAARQTPRERPLAQDESEKYGLFIERAQGGTHAASRAARRPPAPRKAAPTPAQQPWNPLAFGDARSSLIDRDMWSQMERHMRKNTAPASCDISCVSGYFDRIMTKAAQELLNNSILLITHNKGELPPLIRVRTELMALMQNYRYPYVPYNRDQHLHTSTRDLLPSRDPKDSNWYLIWSTMGLTRAHAHLPLETWSQKLMGYKEKDWLHWKIQAYTTTLRSAAWTQKRPGGNLTVEDKAFAIYDEILYTVMQALLNRDAYDASLESICYMLKSRLDAELKALKRDLYRNRELLVYKPPHTFALMAFGDGRNVLHARWPMLLQANVSDVVRFRVQGVKP